MTEDFRRPPWPVFAVTNFLIGTAFISTWIVFLIPPVDLVRERKQLPPIIPFLKYFYDFNPWLFIIGTPLITTGIATAVAVGLRFVLPVHIRRHFCWRHRLSPDRPQQPRVPNVDPRSAVTALIIASSATAILIFAATHVHVDRTNRRPLVTWSGPMLDCLQPAVYLVWTLSVIAIVLACRTHVLIRSKWFYLAFISACLGMLNIGGSLLFWAAIYED